MTKRLSTRELYQGLGDQRLKLTVIMAGIQHVMSDDEGVAFLFVLEGVQDFLRLAEDELGTREDIERGLRSC